MLTPTKPVKSCECSSPCGDCCGCTKESIGLGNVDNTSDLNKPLSTAMINALSGKVDLDTFTQLKNRVLALENSMPDITDLEHRMDEAEDDILGLNAGYNSLHNTVLSMADSITELGGRVTGVSDGLVTVGTRVDALEDEDSNNVKLTGVSEQTIVGKLKANDPSSGATDKTLVTANWVSQSGDNSPNNLVHKNGNETITGFLTLMAGALRKPVMSKVNNSSTVDYIKVAELDMTIVSSAKSVHGILTPSYVSAYRYHLEFWIGAWSSNGVAYACTHAVFGNNSKLRITYDNGIVSIWYMTEATQSNYDRGLFYFPTEVYGGNYKLSGGIKTFNDNEQIVISDGDPYWDTVTIITPTVV